MPCFVTLTARHSKVLSDKDEKLVRDVSPSQGLLQSAISVNRRLNRSKSQNEEAPERAKRLSPISRLCLIFYKFFLLLNLQSPVVNGKCSHYAKNGYEMLK